MGRVEHLRDRRESVVNEEEEVRLRLTMQRQARLAEQHDVVCLGVARLKSVNAARNEKNQRNPLDRWSKLLVK